jgi:hypothetical protein
MPNFAIINELEIRLKDHCETIHADDEWWKNPLMYSELYGFRVTDLPETDIDYKDEVIALSSVLILKKIHEYLQAIQAAYLTEEIAMEALNKGREPENQLIYYFPAFFDMLRSHKYINFFPDLLNHLLTIFAVQQGCQSFTLKYDLRPKEETTLNEKPSLFQKVEFFSNIRNIERVKDGNEEE